MKNVTCKRALNVKGIQVCEGEVLKVERLPLVSKVKADSVFLFVTETGERFVMSESKATQHFESKREVEVPVTRPEGMTVMEYAGLKLQKLGINPKGRCTCPRCGGSGMWSNGRRQGACFLCNRDGEVSELQAMMHEVKMDERHRQNLPTK